MKKPLVNKTVQSIVKLFESTDGKFKSYNLSNGFIHVIEISWPDLGGYYTSVSGVTVKGLEQQSKVLSERMREYRSKTVPKMDIDEVEAVIYHHTVMIMNARTKNLQDKLESRTKKLNRWIAYRDITWPK